MRLKAKAMQTDQRVAQRELLFPGLSLVFWQSKRSWFERQRMQGFLLRFCYEGVVSCRRKNGRVFFLHPGDLAVVCQEDWELVCFPKEEAKGFDIVIDWERFYVFLKESLAMELEKPRLLSQRNSSLLELEAGIQPVMERLFLGERNLAKHKLEMLALLSMVNKSDVAKTQPPCFSQDTVERTWNLAQCLREDLAQEKPLEPLAESYGIGLSTLKNCFRQMYGETMYAYRRQWRMEKAKELLEKTDMPISAVAKKVGYENFGKFSAAFFACVGQLPHHYRKNFSEKRPPVF